MNHIKLENDRIMIPVELPEALKRIVEHIRIWKGTPYLVGGAVIDLLNSTIPKDWDIEVFNLSYEELLEILQEHGKADLIGNQFGIIKLKVGDLDLEFSIPRIESKTGLRHSDFDITLVPNLSVKEAARRRDFTINAMYLNLVDNLLEDPFGGFSDLRRSFLTYVDKKTFREDPLRAFRAVQILGRKVSGYSIQLSCVVGRMHLNNQLDNLSGDSIFGELNKLFLKGTYFGSAASFMEGTGLLEWLNLESLYWCPQKPEHHPEGNAWEHTKLVMEEAFRYRDDLLEDWRLPFMYGMLLHDLGKLESLDMETLSTHGHEKTGETLARKFMERLTNCEDLINKVVAIVGCHMRPRFLKASNKKAWLRLQNKCPLNVLAYVSMVDEDGRKLPKNGKNSESFRTTMQVFEELGEPSGEIKPILMGRHLIEKGMKPGKDFGVILKAAYDYQIETGCEEVTELLEKGICQLASRTV